MFHLHAFRKVSSDISLIMAIKKPSDENDERYQLDATIMIYYHK